MNKIESMAATSFANAHLAPVGGKRANGYCPVFSVINGEVLA